MLNSFPERRRVLTTVESYWVEAGFDLAGHSHSTVAETNFPFISILWGDGAPLPSVTVIKSAGAPRIKEFHFSPSATSIGYTVSPVRPEWNSGSAGSGQSGFQWLYPEMWLEINSLYTSHCWLQGSFTKVYFLSLSVGLTPKHMALVFRSLGLLFPRTDHPQAELN